MPKTISWGIGYVTGVPKTTSKGTDDMAVVSNTVSWGTGDVTVIPKTVVSLGTCDVTVVQKRVSSHSVLLLKLCVCCCHYQTFGNSILHLLLFFNV
jgi:hypothetical protein